MKTIIKKFKDSCGRFYLKQSSLVEAGEIVLMILTLMCSFLMLFLAVFSSLIASDLFRIFLLVVLAIFFIGLSWFISNFENYSKTLPEYFIKKAEEALKKGKQITPERFYVNDLSLILSNVKLSAARDKILLEKLKALLAHIDKYEFLKEELSHLQKRNNELVKRIFETHSESDKIVLEMFSDNSSSDLN